MYNISRDWSFECFRIAHLFSYAALSFLNFSLFLLDILQL